MKRTLTAIAIALSSIAWGAPAPPPHQTVPPVKPGVPPIQRTCPDPAVVYLMSRVVVEQPGGGQIELTGQVVNRGNAPFVSRPGQAEAQILVSRAAGEAPLVLARQALVNLQVGHGGSIQFRRFWPRNVQFPPTFSLVISYDPDILQDGDPKNDDCSQANNRIDLAGSVIDHEWPRLVTQRPH